MTIDSMMYVFGFIASAWGVVSIIRQVLEIIKKPNADQNLRISDLEARVGRIEGYLKTDKDAIETLERGTVVMMKTLLALTKHGIDGNNIDALKSSEKELEEYIFEGRRSTK